jgi:2,3-diketo-5-methylthio-1-phosphopentane phosphatase
MPDKYTVFFDFDNTITSFDVIDDMLERFSMDESWIKLENKWKSGKIGSKACLKGQIGSIRISKNKLNSYLKRVKIDPHFKKTLSLLRSEKIKTFVLSDNFDYILKNILKSNGVKGLPVFSNKVRISGERLVPSFPLSNNSCGDYCGHCKLSSMRRLSDKDNTIVYVGDGCSDICPAKAADVVFAKDALLEHFKSKKLDHIPLKNMNDVYKYFKTRSLT